MRGYHLSLLMFGRGCWLVRLKAAVLVPSGGGGVAGEASTGWGLHMRGRGGRVVPAAVASERLPFPFLWHVEISKSHWMRTKFTTTFRHCGRIFGRIFRSFGRLARVAPCPAVLTSAIMPADR